MKVINFEISLEDLTNREGSQFVTASNKTFVDQNGCEIDITEIITPASEITNDSFGSIQSTEIVLPVFLEQTYKNMGRFTDFDFIVWSGDTITGSTDESVRVIGLSEEAYYSNIVNEFVTGFTNSYLDLVTSYNINEPYVVGLNLDSSPNTSFTGVLNIGTNFVEYVVNGDIVNNEYVEDTGIVYKTFSDQTRTIFSEETNTYIEIPLTTFRTQKKGFVADNISLSELVKEEMFFGIAEKRDTQNDIFFDRDTLSPFESHLRMAEIQTVDGLERYNGGFYNFV